MGQDQSIFSSGVSISSSPSNVSERNSVSQNPDEHIPKEDASDRLHNGGEADQTKGRVADAARGEDEEEEGECGFCLFMKGGGCRDSFIEWEKCVEEAEKNKEDVVEKCSEITSNLKKCMEAHAEYYEPILKAEKEAAEELTKELELEAEKKSDEQSAPSDSSP